MIDRIKTGHKSGARFLRHISIPLNPLNPLNSLEVFFQGIFVVVLLSKYLIYIYTIKGLSLKSWTPPYQNEKEYVYIY